MVKQIAIFLLLLCAGCTLGAALWNVITLPFSNPYHIASILAAAHYNPANNVLRTMTVITAPTLLFIIAYLSSNKLRSVSFAIPRSVEPTIISSGKYFAIAFVALCCALPLHAYLAEEPMYDSFHEGESMGAAVSYDHGQTPFRDFIALHGLIQDPIRSSVAFKLFGHSIAAVRSFESILKIFAWIAVGLTVLQLYRGRLLASAAAISAAAFLSYKGGMTLMQRELPTLLTLFSLLLLHNRLRLNASVVWPSFLVGLLPVFGLIYSLERGIFSLTIAVLGGLSLLYFGKGQRKNIILPALAGIVLGLIGLGFALRWDFASYIQFCFIDMPKYKDLLDGLIYHIAQPRFLIYLIILAGMTLYAAWLFAGVRNKTDMPKSKAPAYMFVSQYFPEFITILTAIILYRGVMGRADMPHLEYSTIGVVLALIACFAQALLHIEEKITSKFALLVRCETLSVSVIFLCVFGFQIASGKLSSNFPLNKPDAAYLPEEYTQTIAYIRNNLNDDDSFLSLTNEASWYYFLDKPCPVRFNIIMFASPTFFQEEVVRELAAKPPKIILLRNNHWACRINDIDIEEATPKITDFVFRHYHRDTTIGSQQLLRLIK